MRRGWFDIPGIQTGDRTGAQQAEGLDAFDFSGKSVLDLGCAEGLLAQYALDRGAASVWGIDILEDHIEEANRQCPHGVFLRMDLTDLAIHLDRLPPHFDVVLLLSVVHKMKQPLDLIDCAVTLTDRVIIRLPNRVLADVRSAPLRVNIPNYMTELDFLLVAEPATCLSEWMGLFERM